MADSELGSADPTLAVGVWGRAGEGVGAERGRLALASLLSANKDAPIVAGAALEPMRTEREEGSAVGGQEDAGRAILEARPALDESERVPALGSHKRHLLSAHAQHDPGQARRPVAGGRRARDAPRVQHVRLCGPAGVLKPEHALHALVACARVEAVALERDRRPPAGRPAHPPHRHPRGVEPVARVRLLSGKAAAVEAHELHLPPPHLLDARRLEAEQRLPRARRHWRRVHVPARLPAEARHHPLALQHPPHSHLHARSPQRRPRLRPLPAPLPRGQLQLSLPGAPQLRADSRQRRCGVHDRDPHPRHAPAVRAQPVRHSLVGRQRRQPRDVAQQTRPCCVARLSGGRVQDAPCVARRKAAPGHGDQQPLFRKRGAVDARDVGQVVELEVVSAIAGGEYGGVSSVLEHHAHIDLAHAVLPPRRLAAQLWTVPVELGRGGRAA
eukprot:1374650-Rhodomonas_salina.1